MKKLDPNMNCPSCQGALKPKVLECASCDLSVQGHFEVSQFSKLGQNDLHFLRVFVHCEGKIRDMEKALGVSYPTVKAKLSNLKGQLGLGNIDESVPAEETTKPKKPDTPMPPSKKITGHTTEPFTASTTGKQTISELLANIEAGRVSVEEAINRINKPN